MTKKDFELIADILNKESDVAAVGCRPAITDTARHFAKRLAAVNPQFNAEKFLTAAGAAPTRKERGKQQWKNQQN